MRFVLSEEFWALDALTPAEWHLVTELPGTAAGEKFDESVNDTLYPSPLSPDTPANEETMGQVEDWEELILPDIEDAFADARKRVESDLDAVESLPTAEIIDLEEHPSAAQFAELRRLMIPLDHVEDWYSTLNQARILMNEAYDLAESDERLQFHAGESKSLDDETVLLYAQYELYSAIQTILVEHVMRP